MSAAAAVAAPCLPRPRLPQDEVPLLETMPVREPLPPPVLAEGMRRRLLAAVKQLLAEVDAVADGKGPASDSVRLAAVVAMAKTYWDADPEKMAVSVSAPEMARWLGVQATTVRHVVRPLLQRGPVHSTIRETPPAPGATYGRALGIEWKVEGLRQAWRSGGADDPLRLKRAELATLLRVCEVLFAPGWSTTRPGVLAWRTGHGAATDRLALLMAVLTGRQEGRVRLCAGAVDRRGRLAATVGRWLGRDSAEGQRVLARLEFGGAVVRTPGRREGLVVPVVAQAWQEWQGAKRAAGAVPVRRIKVPSQKRPEAPSRPGVGGGATAWVDQIRIPDASSQVSPYKTADLLVGPSASLHASHAGGEILGDQSSAGLCCSGSAVGGDQRCGVCAYGREDQAPVQAEEPAASGDGAGHPLRGEKQPPNSPSKQTRSQPPAVRRGPVPAPPAELQQALAPVTGLWERVGTHRGRQLVINAVKCELASIDRLLSVETPAAPEETASVLAARLEDRLAHAGGPGQVTSPVGWLVHRGLPPRGCGEDGCAEGWLLHRQRPCPRCEDHLADRRALRDRAYRNAAATCADGQTQPTPQQLSAAYAQHLAEESAVIAAAEQERIEDARKHRAEEREAELRRAATERERAALPCTDCGQPKAAGLCGNCQWIRGQHDQLERVLAKAVRDTVAARPDLTEDTARQRLADETKQALRQRIAFEVRDSVAPELRALGIAEQAAEEAAFRHMQVATGWVDPATSPAPPLLASLPAGDWA